MSLQLFEVTSESEFDAIWSIHFKAFHNPYNAFSKFFNPIHTSLDEAVTASKERHVRMRKANKACHWTKVVKTKSNAACWMLNVGAHAPDPFVANWHIEGTDEKFFAEKLIGGLQNLVTKRVPRPYVERKTTVPPATAESSINTTPKSRHDQGKNMWRSKYASSPMTDEDIVSPTKKRAFDPTLHATGTLISSTHSVPETSADNNIEAQDRNVDRSARQPAQKPTPFFCTNCGKDYSSNQFEFYSVHLKQCKISMLKKGNFSDKYDQNTGRLKVAPSTSSATKSAFSTGPTYVTPPSTFSTPEDGGARVTNNKWANARSVTSLGSGSTESPKKLQPSSGMMNSRFASMTMKDDPSKLTGLAGSRFAQPISNAAPSTAVTKEQEASTLPAVTKEQEASTLPAVVKEQEASDLSAGAEHASPPLFDFKKNNYDAEKFEQWMLKLFRNAINPVFENILTDTTSNSVAASTETTNPGDSSGHNSTTLDTGLVSSPFKNGQLTVMTEDPPKQDQSTVMVSNPTAVSVTSCENPFTSSNSANPDQALPPQQNSPDLQGDRSAPVLASNSDYGNTQEEFKRLAQTAAPKTIETDEENADGSQLAQPEGEDWEVETITSDSDVESEGGVQIVSEASFDLSATASTQMLNSICASSQPMAQEDDEL
ncbi:hypothetical protein SLS60_010826 [Paraconiothyrium brasiliense]|uniref:Uncharacterized protein n=1 Tax=Paraconiothyrium brasiliense TaxID=300254 RepID=A0ABR3QMB4_9PLEO